MAARPPAPERRRRPRGATLERPVNARMYRGTWMLVGIPLLLASLGIGRAEPLPPPVLPPAFDRDQAVALTRELAAEHPNRVAGTADAADATSWVVEQFRSLGMTPERRPFVGDVPGRGKVRFVNVLARVPGRTEDAVVVMAHRDNLGVGPGANDNASGTATLLELARTYAFLSAPGGTGGGAEIEPPGRTIVFVSTDGGAIGGFGAEAFARNPAIGGRVAGVVVLDSLGGSGDPRIQLGADVPRSPPPDFVESLAVHVLQQTGERPARASTLEQLVDLAFPLSFYEQAPLTAAGVPAVTLTTGDDGAEPDFSDSPSRFTGLRMGALGRAAQGLVTSLAQGAEFGRKTSPRVYLGPRVIEGWAIQLVLVAALLPFFAAVVDLFARCRRRRIPLSPALRSYARRLVFWLAVGAVWSLLGLAGAWPTGDPRPPVAGSDVAADWALLPIGLLAAAAAGVWLVAREGLLPRSTPTAADEIGGYTAALLVLGVLALVVITLNAYALLLLLPSLHAWLWLPQVRTWSRWMRGLLLVGGLAGPALVLASLAGRFALGGDAPWYALTLLSIGYIEPSSALVALVWAAAAGQLFALAAHRYAPASRVRRGGSSWLRHAGGVVRHRRRARGPVAVGEAHEV